ncbi:MAG TPA: sigma-70 family RNA polymerase sigma factor [Cerasibacillus sp.]|uniref:sigma-70 family RNA polymerase sigma factor n=1 Tax=Cerasibacillus sp. TaxID=2498711 RepID=UPI002F42D515
MGQSLHETDILQIEDRVQQIEQIMNMYGHDIKRLVYTYMKNEADTDEVTQDVFLTVYEKLSTFKGEASLRSWIYSIAINKCKDHLRSWQVRNQRLKERLKQLTLSTETLSPEQQLLKQNEIDHLVTIIMMLPVKYREILILYYFQEFTTDEISNMLKLNPSTVRSRLSRGRKRLKQLFIERGVLNG